MSVAVVPAAGVLLPELVVSIILLLTLDAGLMQDTGSIPLLAALLEHLDRFNHLAPGHDRDDNEDLAWPGLMGMPGCSCVTRLRVTRSIVLFKRLQYVFVHRVILHRTEYEEQRRGVAYTQSRPGEPQ